MDHRTLIRAATDFADKESVFALNCGLMALYWICDGRAYDPTTSEVLTAYAQMLRAAELAKCKEIAIDALREMLGRFPQEQLVKATLAPALSIKPPLQLPTG